jgi:hypothetical protein
LIRKGQTDEAISPYHEALRLKPEYAAARKNPGIELGNCIEAAEALEQMTAEYRAQPAALEVRCLAWQEKTAN